MKRKIILCAVISILTVLLTSCGEKVTDVTWQQLCDANRPEAILEKVDTYKVEQSYSEIDWYVSKKDGEITWSHVSEYITEDYRDGATYRYIEDNGITAEVNFLAPGTDPLKMVYEGYDLGLEQFEDAEDIRLKNGKYHVNLKTEDEEFGAVLTAVAVFDSQTLLLESMETTVKLGLFTESNKDIVTYGFDSDIPFVQRSYETISQADNAVALTLHYPNGEVKDYSVCANADLYTASLDYESIYSLCWDKDCTAKVDDLGWVDGDHASLYLYEGEVPFAPPALKRITERSRFDSIFERDYNSYGQSLTYYDEQDNWMGNMDLLWILNEDSKMEYYIEKMDGNGEIVFSEMGTDGMWYSWSAENGYKVDLYEDNAYAEKQMDRYRIYLKEERITAEELECGEYEWFIKYAEDSDDGTKTEYTYNISQDFDYIDRVVIEDYDDSEKLTQKTDIYIGGNGGNPVDRNVREEITEPTDADTIKLTVVTPNGKKEIAVRKDSAVLWNGEAVYQDKECTAPVSDLSWVNGKTAEVYVK